ITNAASGTIYGFASGINVGYGAANVYNAGTISALYGVGVDLTSDDTIINAAGGTIYGVAYGINVGLGSATVVNEGSIGSGTCGCSTYDGVFLSYGGAATNDAS